MSEPWQIPARWQWSSMGEVATVVGGGTPKSDQPEYFGGDIPWITPADLSGYTAKFISAGARSITQAGLDNSGAKMMPAGSVLFSSRAPIGYVAIAANPVSTNQGFKTFVLRDGLTSDFVYYYLQHAKKLAVEMASGTTFLEISGKKAAQLPIPVAPLPEQRRIVAEIEKQFTRLEAGVAALRRTQANLKRYRAAVLKAACEGCLVQTEATFRDITTGDRASKPNHETGPQLLARILVERRRIWQGRGQYEEPAIPETGNLPCLPKGWCYTTLEAVADVIDPNPSHRMPKYIADGIPLVSSENFTGSEDIDFSIGKKVARETYLQQQGRYSIENGDFVLSRIGTIGKTRFLPIGREYCLSHALVVLKVRSHSISRRWLRRTIASESILAQAHNGVQSVGVPDLGMGKIRNFVIPLPPASEQIRIESEIERRLSIVEELETVVNSNLQRSSRLRQAILRQAFAGLLTT